MKVVGTSREGCWAILMLSALVLVLGLAGHLNFELNLAACIFIGLNLFAISGLLRGGRTKLW